MTKKENTSRLYAIADLHANRPQTWKLLQTLPNFSNDWLILVGDVCDGWAEDRFTDTLQLLKHRFAKVFWTTGNHELYTLVGSRSDDPNHLRGTAKYDRLVQLCRNVDVVTPEDPFVRWDGLGSKPNSKSSNSSADNSNDFEPNPIYICPIFTLYDYSFRPPNVTRSQCLNWAQETKVMCTDEFTLHPEPYHNVDEWCHARVEHTKKRLDKLMEETCGCGWDENMNNNNSIVADYSQTSTLNSPKPQTILASHFSLRYDMVYLPYLPRFSLWCGTKLTEDWHRRYNAHTVVYGHTHVRNSTVFEGCRFHECSLGYPNQYNNAKKISDYLCPILPLAVKEEADGCSIC